MKPLPCPLHPDVEPGVSPVVLGPSHTEMFGVKCPVWLCWSGPICVSQFLAIEAWNERMGK